MWFPSLKFNLNDYSKNAVVYVYKYHVFFHSLAIENTPKIAPRQ